MQNLFKKRSTRSLLIVALCLCALIPVSVNAQQTATLESSQARKAVATNDEKLRRISRLEELSQAIQEKSQQLQTLKSQKDISGGDTNLDLNIEITAHEFETLNRTFEQIAIGSTNLDIFNINDQPKTWQDELTFVIKPLLERLRGLTEQPRMQETLRQTVNAKKLAAAQANRAVVSIELLLKDNASDEQVALLELIKGKWLRTKEDAERQEQLALYQLSNISAEKAHWLTSLTSSVLSFLRERGVTIVIAVFVSLLIWYLLAGFRKIVDGREKLPSKYLNRSTYRVVAYSQRLLTGLLITTAVLTVFFIRGDVLLIVITLTLLFAGVLGLKNILPRFIAESRLLLNVGAVREDEQVVIDGVPWRVMSINIFSILCNPEIEGTLRLPLAGLKDLTSRPINEEKWFPSKIGDWVLDGNDRNLYQVTRQTPTVVELQSAQGSSKVMATSDYFSAGLVNLTQSNEIRIVTQFGVGYELQDISLSDVPETFKKYAQTYLESADIGTTKINIRAEFKKAGDSSLDYIIIASVGADASHNFYRMERILQQACVAACIDKGWVIPFPQLTVHHGASNEKDSDARSVSPTRF